MRIVVVPATTTANADTNGSISINDLVSNAIVYTMATARTSSPSVYYGDTFRSMSFTYNTTVSINDDEDFDATGETTDCTSFLADI